MIDTKKLESQLQDPGTDKAGVIKDLVQAIEEIVASNNEMKRLADEAAAISEKAIEDQKKLFDSVLELTTAMKNIHIILNLNDPKVIEELKLELAKWVLRPEAIKLGVVTNGKVSAAHSASDKPDAGA